MNIAVFGGCYENKEYEERVYKLIKEKTINKDNNIISCGTIGTIGAVCKAANENGLKNIAVSLKKWEKYINEYVDEKYIFENELERLKYVTDTADCYIVFDGDIGTLEELFVILVLAEDSNKPIYILGENILQSINLLIERGVITSKVINRYICINNW